MTKQLETQVRAQNGMAVVELRGEINSAAEEILNTAYAEAEGISPTGVVLNFAEVGYINSTGIALIVGLLAQARKTHHKLVVCGLSEHYQEIFRITRLSDFMEIYDDESSALAG
ncbi:MAG: STAS domain-containing protein [Anaerolineaceae bacterium]|nr:STAS domain-containing protein [Anaerolineaceae bacterium]